MKLYDWLALIFSTLLFVVLASIFISDHIQAHAAPAADQPAVVEMKLPDTRGIWYRKLPDFEGTGCTMFIIVAIDPDTSDGVEEWRPVDDIKLFCGDILRPVLPPDEKPDDAVTVEAGEREAAR